MRHLSANRLPAAFLGLLTLLFCTLSAAACQPVPTHTPTGVPPSATPTRHTATPSSAPTGTPTPAGMPTPAGTPTPTGVPTATATPTPRAGYGIHVKGVNYADDSLDKAVALHFEWIKIYDYPPPERLPFKVLYRVNLPRPDEDWSEWGHYRYLDAELYADRIDAYEIGNEPNLIEEWGKPPDPAAYAELLQIAYQQIKSADPDALIVSAGMAPVNGSGDPHHVNDIDFVRGMYKHGAAAYFDVLGTHPFGFAYPPEMPHDGWVCDREIYTTDPIPHLNCRPVNQLCFRRAELLREVMLEYGDQDKAVWATEFGWLIRPPDCCQTQSDWSTRYWQVVSERTQARYLLRAYTYADRHWPWMDVMFLWNLDFSRYFPGPDETCPHCESMGWYSILNPDGSPRLAYRWLLGQR